MSQSVYGEQLICYLKTRSNMVFQSARNLSERKGIFTLCVRIKRLKEDLSQRRTFSENLRTKK